MIAYNKTWLDNLLVQEEADKAFAVQCISSEELEAVKQRYPVGFYRPNIFIRGGLFLLTVVIALCGFGLFALLFQLEHEGSFAGMCLFFALVSYISLELMVGVKKHYRSGVDDALIWMTGIFIVIGVDLYAYDFISGSENALLITVIAAYLSLRFGRSGTVAVAIVALLGTVFFAYTHSGLEVKAATPFLLLLLCVLLYLSLKKTEKQPAAKRYPQCLMAAEIVLLICFYAAGNYYVVREGSIVMFRYDTPPPGISFAWFFWCWTIFIPLAYLFRGIRKKDALFLRVGLLLVAVIIFTVRYYHYVMPVEMAMTIGGCLLLLIAYTLIRWLRQPKHGFSSIPGDDPHFTEKLNVEALLLVESFGRPVQQPADAGGTTFGGGSGSGGGASGEF